METINVKTEAHEVEQDSVLLSTIGPYGIFLPAGMSTAEESESRNLALAWAKATIADLAPLGGPNVILTIGDAQCSASSYIWQATIIRRQENDEPWVMRSDPSSKLFKLQAEQYYISRRLSNPEDNYAGTFDVTAMILQRDGTKGKMFSGSRLALILRLSAAHYYEQISKLYPAYEVDYLNSLRYTEVTEPQLTVVRP